MDDFKAERTIILSALHQKLNKFLVSEIIDNRSRESSSGCDSVGVGSGKRERQRLVGRPPRPSRPLEADS